MMAPRGAETPATGERPGVALDDSLRAQLAGGKVDEAATALIEELGPSVLGYLCALHGDDDGADVFSMWSEDIWKGLPGFRFESSARTWGFRIAWNASARFRRDGWRRRRERLPTSAASRIAASVVLGSRPPARDDRLDELRRDLDPADHTLLVLRLDREMSFEEIADVLGAGGRAIQPATLRKRFERLKARLTAQARKKGLLP